MGNLVVQRLLAQRDSGGFELDEESESRIEAARGGGQALDPEAAEELGEAMGADFDGVRVHTSRESDELNQQLNARAFTTGADIFFRQGEYSPRSNRGRQLLAHELTHVVQQSRGRVGGSGGGMTVNEPGDAFEQEADAVAEATSQGNSRMSTEASAQRQVAEEEEMLQMQEEEEEMLQMQEEKGELQMKSADRTKGSSI